MRTRVTWLMFFIVLLLDQLTKNLAKNALEYSKSIIIIPDFFNLTLVFNRGAAFGIFSNFPDPYRHIALGIVTVVALFIVFCFMFKEAKNDRLAQVCLGAILGGAIGNLIDRFYYDSVIDFLDFYIGKYHWPAFNVADSAISVGVFFLAIKVLFVSNRKAAESELNISS